MPTEPRLTPAARLERLLHREPVVWLSTVRPDGTPHLVPIWFSWDGREILIASKPHAQKVRNLRANPTAMLALGEAEDDFDVGLLEGRAELLVEPAAAVLPASHLEKYRREMAGLRLSAEDFLATYSQVIRITPTRFLPWHGRTPRIAGDAWSGDQRLTASIRRIASSLAPRQGWPQYPEPQLHAQILVLRVGRNRTPHWPGPNRRRHARRNGREDQIHAYYLHDGRYRQPGWLLPVVRESGRRGRPAPNPTVAA